MKGKGQKPSQDYGGGATSKNIQNAFNNGIIYVGWDCSRVGM